MKKAILYTVVSSGILMLSGCNETWNPGGGNEGAINPVVTLDYSTVSSRNNKPDARSEAQAITVDDLSLRLTPLSGTGNAREWNKLADFKNDEKFNVGSYTFEAYYGDKNAQGFESPYYYGASTVTVREGETSSVAVTAQLANSMLSITYTDDFVAYFSNYSVDVQSLNGQSVTYARNETRPVYVTPGTVQLTVNLDKPNGSSATYRVPSFDAVARHHYHVQLDVNAGEATLVITFDDTMASETVSVQLDDLENIPAPTVTASQSPVDMVVGTEAPAEFQFVVNARGGIASAVLTTTSIPLKEDGWPATVDLIGTSTASKATMTSLGFKEIGLWKNPDRMAVVDLAGVLPNIKYKEGVDNTATFTLTVTDRLSQQSEAVSVTVNIERLALAIVANEEVHFYDDKAVLTIDYNGADAAGRIGVQYLTGAGRWDDLPVESVAVKARATASYTVTVSGLPTDAARGESPVKLKAIAKNAAGAKLMESAEYTIERTPVNFSLTVDEGNVYATRAIGIINHTSENVADFASRAKAEISADGGVTYRDCDFTLEDGNHLKIAGLNPATAYTLRLTADGQSSRPVSFTTEAALQLPNAGMEDWYSEDGKSSFQKWFYPWAQGASNAVWNTYNPVTMSQGSSATQSNYAYDATSGTVFTSDAKSGSKAAQIRTVGWGSGNKASANAFNRWAFSTCKHVSAGQLFLGTWEGVEAIQDATPNYGIEFASRPTSMTFWYKYAMMNRNGNDNGQKGVAIIRMLDAAGNVISEQTAELDSNANYSDVSADTDYSVNGQYAEKTLALTYPVPAAKAAKIVVIFKSTQLSTSELEDRKNQDNMRPPKPLNLSNHEYLGSSLLVDDITLNY